ncbi:MAG: hypothetical protein KGJ09_06735 [Candidatus Omnitrophica bacterium]|nr:hypothetical protein [Candidatus Omnitrophota bacterium]MDE2009760.1 hypothetical protein [Candidatus Omnitrophota bacterium]MDE2213845.1 hypothetical protein [Candidatus Omnitrophota bacterium]
MSKMKETDPFIQKIRWETSDDQSHQFYVCEEDKRQEFEDFVHQIKKKGYVISLQGISYICIDIGEYLYWTKWDMVEDTATINRKLIKE